MKLQSPDSPIQTETVLQKVASLGVKDPDNPTNDDLKVVLNAAHEKKQMSPKELSTYLKTITPSVNKLLDAWKEFSTQDGLTSRKHLDNINIAIQAQRERMNKAESESEREKATEEIIRLVSRSETNVREGRFFLWTLAAGAFTILGLALKGWAESQGGGGRRKT